jgi:hypothetical protein
VSEDGKARRCQGITSQGRRCDKLIGSSATLCFLHDPEAAQRRKEMASKAAKARHGGGERAEIVELRQEMHELAQEVRARKVTPGVGSVVNQILGNMIKTYEQQRKQVEFDEIRHEMGELRELFAAEEHIRWISTGTSFRGCARRREARASSLRTAPGTPFRHRRPSYASGSAISTNVLVRITSAARAQSHPQCTGL